MIRYCLQRLLAALPILFGILGVTFLLFHVAAGDPVLLMLGKNAKPKEIEALRQELGLQLPLFYGHWQKTEWVPAQDFRWGWGTAQPVAGVTWVRNATGAGGWLRLEPQRTITVVPQWVAATGERFRLRVCAQGELTVAGQTLHGVTWATRTVDLPPEMTALAFCAGPAGAELLEYRVEKYQASPWQSQFSHCLREVLDLRHEPGGDWHISFLDFGRTRMTGEKVSNILLEGVVPSLLLMGSIFAVELVASLALALLAAGWHDRWPDRLLTVGSVAGMSVSYLVFILLAQYVVAYRWNLFPVWGFASWRNLVLPVLVGVVSGLGGHVRYYRTVFLNELYRDHVRTARAKGCGTVRVLLNHVLPNALAPIITRVSVLLPFLFTGSLLLESFFGIPGLGYAGVNALANGEVQVLKALVLLGGMLFVVANLLADLACAAADPRIRLK